MHNLKKSAATQLFPALLLAVALAGCAAARTESGQTANTPQARQCAKALEMAAEEIDNGRDIKGRGALSIMRASHTHGSAKKSQYRGNYPECIEKAMKAQGMVREAFRTQAQERER